MKRIVFRYKGGIVSALLDETDRLIELHPCEENASRLIPGNIYMGKVKNILKNINAAFVDIGNNEICFLPMSDTEVFDPEQPGHALFGQRNHPTKLSPGDELVVQIVKEPIKTKQAMVSSHLDFAGRYCVLLAGSKGINISKKINDAEWRQHIKEVIAPHLPEHCGIIVRTNAYEVPEHLILEELENLTAEYQRILSSYIYRPAYTQLYSTASSWLTDIRDTNNMSLTSIETDDVELFAALSQYIQAEFPQDAGKLKLWNTDTGEASLLLRYHLEKGIKEALAERVWLSSGAYLVIQPTEALVVIDVNTGKSVEKKDMQQHLFRINLEAAREVVRQIRLRNLSGIILVDFINMKSQEKKDELMSVLAQGFRADPIKTVLVGMSQLELVEITRHKVRKALHETFLT